MQTRVGMFQIFFLAIVLFTTTFGKVLFSEEFNEDWESRWQKSTWKAENQGTFERTKGKWHSDDEMAYGIQTSTDLKFYELSTKLPTPITTGKTPFVFQYSLKFEQPIECGGGYMKLVGPDFDPKKFGGETPLLIMFGPDICGNDNKIHLILDFNGTGKLWNKKPAAPTDKLTHVYTMVLYPNGTYGVYVDTQPIENGTINEDWDISVPKMIPDPNDKKPEDWDDRMYIEDPSSAKPADWEDEEMIEDKDATKPEDWDEAKEGEWKRPKTKNPKYKGPWTPKKIYNPQYKGVWTPKKILNPDFKEQPMTPYTIGGIGIDVWQVKHGAIFDNVMITDSLEDAFEHVQKIQEKQVAAEKEFKAEMDKEEEARNAVAREKLKEHMKEAQEKQQDQGVEKEDL